MSVSPLVGKWRILLTPFIHLQVTMMTVTCTRLLLVALTLLAVFQAGRLLHDSIFRGHFLSSPRFLFWRVPHHTFPEPHDTGIVRTVCRLMLICFAKKWGLGVVAIGEGKKKGLRKRHCWELCALPLCDPPWRNPASPCVLIHRMSDFLRLSNFKLSRMSRFNSFHIYCLSWEI